MAAISGSVTNKVHGLSGIVDQAESIRHSSLFVPLFLAPFADAQASFFI